MMRAPRIVALGRATWEHVVAVARFPVPGGPAIGRQEAFQPGGTAAAAAALARLGADTSLVAAVGDDAAGAALRAALVAAGVDTTALIAKTGTATDRATVIVRDEPPARALTRHPGAQLVKGDRLDISAIFGHDVVLLDLDDVPLRRFLLDLPAHTLPRTTLLGTLTALADAATEDALDLALRHDVIVGASRELATLTGIPNLDAALAAVTARMPGNTLRAAIILHGNGCTVVTPTRRQDVALPHGADATADAVSFAAGIAYGLTRRWDWPRVGRFAHAVGALNAPTLADVASHLGVDVATLRA